MRRSKSIAPHVPNAVRPQRAAFAVFAIALAIGVVMPTAHAACDNLASVPITYDVDWQTQVKPIIKNELGGVCTTCHGVDGAGGLDLSDEFVDAIYKIVGNSAIPGDPRGSQLFDKVNCEPPTSGGSRMPFGGDPLSLEQQAMIYDWIEQGALGEDPKKPISRDFIFRGGNESVRR